jgi:hypothetical protein
VLFGTLLAWVGANEAPGPQVLTGGALVIGALAGNEWLAWRERQAQSEDDPSDVPINMA